MKFGDTDGDGIPDDQDPDPTTPDLVLTIEFHSFYRNAVWQYYINGVTDPSWLNQPPTEPRVIKLKNYHIGDQLSLQMLYLSGPYGDVLFFLVPLQSKGAYSVMAAADDTPLLHFTDSAPLGQLTPPGGWPAMVWSATLTNFAGPCAGFDDETPKYVNFTHAALSVPQNGTNTVTAMIFPTNIFSQVTFQTAASFISVSPTQATSATQLLQFSGTTNGTNIASSYFLAVGNGAQDSDHPVGAIADVDVLPKGTNVTVAIYAVSSTGEPATTPTNVPLQTQLKSYLDSVFGKQANVFINVLPLVSTNVNYDLNANGVMDFASGNFLSDEMKAVTNAGYVSGAFNVYYVHANNNPAINGLAFGSPLNTIFIRDDHSQSAVNLTAHEVGHLFNPSVIKDVPTAIWGDTDRLMWYSDLNGDPCRLVRHEWTEINKKAK
jgi:hypothetical protein